MITAKDIRWYELFYGLNENELAKIADICSRRTYEKNAVIFDPNTTPDEIFLVESDNDAIQIEISLGDDAGKIVIHTLSKGETFGWAALGPERIKTGTARCLERVSVIAIRGKSLIELMDKENHTGYVVMRNLASIIAERLSYTTVAFRHEIRKAKKLAKVPARV